MHEQTLLLVVEEGLRNGRLSPQLAAYIADEVLGVEACATGYDDTVRLQEPLPSRSSHATAHS